SGGSRVIRARFLEVPPDSSVPANVLRIDARRARHRPYTALAHAGLVRLARTRLARRTKRHALHQGRSGTSLDPVVDSMGSERAVPRLRHIRSAEYDSSAVPETRNRRPGEHPTPGSNRLAAIGTSSHAHLFA